MMLIRDSLGKKKHKKHWSWNIYGNANGNSAGHRCCTMVVQSSEWIIVYTYYLCYTPTVRSWWSSVGQSWSSLSLLDLWWTRWWSDTLWVTLILRFYDCSHSCHVTFQIVVVHWFARNSGWIIVYLFPLLHPPLGADEISWVFMAQLVTARFVMLGLWWRWWSDTLWATLIRFLGLQSFLSCYLSNYCCRHFLCNLIDLSLSCNKLWNSICRLLFNIWMMHRSWLTEPSRQPSLRASQFILVFVAISQTCHTHPSALTPFHLRWPRALTSKGLFCNQGVITKGIWMGLNEISVTIIAVKHTAAAALWFWRSY